MGFGSTAKKLQRVADMAEDLVGRLNELKERVIRMEETVDETNERLSEVERNQAEQRALIEAMATQQNIEVAEVLADIETKTHAEEATDPAEETDAQPQSAVSGSADENA
jgi:hypothetical protein